MTIKQKESTRKRPELTITWMPCRVPTQELAFIGQSMSTWVYISASGYLFRRLSDGLRWQRGMVTK